MKTLTIVRYLHHVKIEKIKFYSLVNLYPHDLGLWEGKIILLSYFTHQFKIYFIGKTYKQNFKLEIKKYAVTKWKVVTLKIWYLF